MEKIVIVFDCGATNVRAVAMNSKGEIMATKAFSNQTHEDPNHKGGRIWHLEEIWSKLCEASKDVTSQIDRNSIVTVTTTTFGVDGTYLDSKGKLLYPVISWQCERTVPIMKQIEKYIPLPELYRINGVNAYSFNTINKLIWFNETLPAIVAKSDRFLFMPSLINLLLTGEKVNDSTMLGTSMLTSLKDRSLSDEILARAHIRHDIFGEIQEPGTIIGKVTENAAARTGIPAGTKVCLAGHDTQFAVFGSGAEINQPVLSSGTWEILMARSVNFSTNPDQLKSGITTEFDAVNGLYDIGLNWLGSGIVEWVRRMHYAECSPETCYNVMIDEASRVEPGSNGVSINPDFAGDINPFLNGQVSGLSIQTSRGEIIRATFEVLAFQLRKALETLEHAGGFKASSIICVGGGSKNALWNQIRADVLNLPVITIDQKETTVLGAACFAFASAGVFSSPEMARARIPDNPKTTHPSENSLKYNRLYTQWHQ